MLCSKMQFLTDNYARRILGDLSYRTVVRGKCLVEMECPGRHINEGNVLEPFSAVDYDRRNHYMIFLE